MTDKPLRAVSRWAHVYKITAIYLIICTTAILGLVAADSSLVNQACR